MKSVFTSILALFAFAAIAQDLPQPSPAASVSQTIGLTEVEVVYSRPGAKGRTIFGDLVPYGEVWRTGANKATAITFSNDVTIDDKKVKAGTYSVFTKPGKKEWTVMFNSETELWGAGNYSSDNDVAVVKVKAAKMADEEESFTIGFTNISDEGADMYMRWENNLS